MPRKAKDQTQELAKFTIAKPSSKMAPVAKVVLPKVEITSAAEILKKLLDEAAKSDCKPAYVRGSLTLY